MIELYSVFVITILLLVGILLIPVWVAKDISKNQKHISAFGGAFFFIAGAFFLYSQFGTPEILPLLAEREGKLQLLKEKIVRNSEEIKSNSKNLKAWADLGDSFMETGQFSAAANAYKQCILLSDGNPALIMAYSRALIMEAEGIVTAEAKKSIEMLLSLQPENEEARYYMALYQMQSGDKQKAMVEMKELYKSLSNDSPLKDMIDSHTD